MKILVLLAAFFLYIQCHDVAKVDVREYHDSEGEDEEMISIDLKKKDGSEDIKMIAQMKIHLVGGIVHINGHRLVHDIVQHIHMNLTIIEHHEGIQMKQRRPVQMRILVVESTQPNGNKVLLVEEEFLKIREYEVIQIEVKQVIFESSIRKPITSVFLEESEIHKREPANDKHVEFNDDMLHLPKHPNHGYGYEGEHYKHHECYYHHKNHGNGSHHRRHHHHRSIKCWYHRLSWRSKLALFSVGFLSLITMVLCCAICAKRRRLRRRALNIAAPMDNSVTVDMDDEKKVKSDESFDFHFEVDNAVVVDDKKALVEDN